MKNGKTLPLIVIIAVNFLWGIDYIAIDYMMDYMTPTVFTLSRLIIGTCILILLVLINRGSLHIRKEDRLRIFISGGIGMALYFTVANLGVELTSASFSSLIMATVPVWGMIGDRIFYKNKITAVKAVCVVASGVGVYFLVSGEPLGVNLPGLAVMLSAAVLWTVYLICVKPLYEKYDLLTLLTGLFISGLIVQIPLTIISRPSGIVITGGSIFVTVATSILCIIIGEFGYIYAVGKLPLTTTAIFENVLPLVTVVFSFVFFGAMLALPQLIGGAIIMISVTMIALRE